MVVPSGFRSYAKTVNNTVAETEVLGARANRVGLLVSTLNVGEILRLRVYASNGKPMLFGVATDSDLLEVVFSRHGDLPTGRVTIASAAGAGTVFLCEIVDER